MALCALGACSSGPSFQQALDRVRVMNQADLEQAQVKATAAGDRVGLWCWQALAPVVGAQGAPLGVADLIEDYRIVRFAVDGPCAGLLMLPLVIP